MNSLLVIPFFIYFLIAGFLAFFIPGRVVFGNQKNISPLGKIVCATVLGIVLFAAQGFVFGYLHARFLTYFYLIFFFGVFSIKKYWQEFKTIKISKDNIDPVSLVLIITGVFAQIFTYLPNGLKMSHGVIMVKHNAPDHIWHATLVEELVKRFPPNEPAIANVPLTDYHYWFNLVTAELIRVFHFPLFFAQTTCMYLLASVLLGIVAWLLSQKIYPSKIFTRWVLFFFYFSGDAAGWITLVTTHSMNWNLSSLINDSSKFLESPAFSYSLVILLTGLYLLFVNKAKLSVRMAIILSILFGSIIAFKVYTGIIVLAGLGLWSAYSVIRKNYSAAFVFIGATIIAGSLFLRVSTAGGGGLFFLPVDIPRDFINQPALGLVDWQLRWVIFQDHHNIPRLIQYGFYMAFVYLITQFGLLLFGFIQTKKSIKILTTDFAIFFYGAILTAFVLGLFFYQKVGGANIWEFFLPAIYLLGILFALQITLLLEHKKKLLQILFICVIILVATPRVFLTIPAYAVDEYFSGFHGLSNEEVASYQYIQSNTSKNSIILTLNQSSYKGYSWYASIFMSRDLFLGGEGVRQIQTQTIIDRKNALRAIHISGNAQEVSGLLHKYNISYIYFYGVPHFGVLERDLPIHSVFTNKFATIFKVN